MISEFVRRRLASDAELAERSAISAVKILREQNACQMAVVEYLFYDVSLSKFVSNMTYDEAADFVDVIYSGKL